LNRLDSFVQALQTDSKGVSPFKVLRRPGQTWSGVGLADHEAGAL
jgi:hypothetical protein